MDCEGKWPPQLSTSKARCMKTFISRVALVCHRWNTITRWKTNYHFWETDLVLIHHKSLCNSAMSLHSARVQAVTDFRQALHTARDSDIRLMWYSSKEVSREHDDIVWSRIFMHYVAMLTTRSSNITRVGLEHLNEYEYSFAKVFLSGLEEPVQLSSVHIVNCGAHPLPNLSESNSQLLRYNIGYHDPRLEFGPQFRILQQLVVGHSARDADPELALLPPALKLLVIGERTRVNPFLRSTPHFLEDLQLGDKAIESAMTWDNVQLLHLLRLTLFVAQDKVMFSTLARLSPPRIESLRLRWFPCAKDSTTKAESLALFHAYGAAVYVRLVKLEIGVYASEAKSNFRQINNFIDICTPALEHLCIEIDEWRNPPPKPYSYCDQGEGPLIRTPKKVTIKAGAPNVIPIPEVLQWLWPGDGMEELEISSVGDSAQPASHISDQSVRYNFDALKTLILINEHSHHIVHHIQGLTSMSVVLKP